MKRILIVDDHDVVRAGVMKVAEQPGIVFGEANNPAQALELVREQEWDLAVVDISLGDWSGLDLLKELKQIRPNLPVLILSMHSEEQYARRGFRAGAAGYITKDSPRHELAKAIQKVLNGGRYVSPDIAEKLVRDLKKDRDRPPHWDLSDREFEVMCLVASGKAIGEIANQLSLSHKTVSTYRARILEKMGFSSNAEMIRYAIQHKLVE